jgi:hypothetical protein
MFHVGHNVDVVVISFRCLGTWYVHTNNEEPSKIYSSDASTLTSCDPFYFGRRGIKNEVHTRLLGSVYLELHCSVTFI